MIESEEIEEEIDVDFDTKSQHASRKGIEESGEDLDQEENNQLEVDIAEDFGEESDSSIPSHIEINDIEKTDYNEYYKFDAVIESIVDMFNITNETNDDLFPYEIKVKNGYVSNKSCLVLIEEDYKKITEWLDR